MKHEEGLTLTELMITVALIGIGILGATATYNAIHRGIQSSKTRTLASNIAQEKMQIIMQKPYYEVLVTTAPAFRTDFTPNIAYDSNYFVPETLTEGGIQFTRYTYVQVIQDNSGVIQILDPMTPDTGMRRITETVVWASESGNKSLAITTVLNNPNTVMSSTWLKGTVTDVATGNPIPGALVSAAENIGWRDTADGSGNYAIDLVPGSFNFQASASGYYSMITPMSVVFNGTTPLNFALSAISTGTIKGTAWIDNHMVISQVVPSTGPSNGIEYVDLYNPTTAPINMGTNANPSTPPTWIVSFDSQGNNYGQQLVYISTFVPANGYYLVSNTGDGAGSPFCSAFTISGVMVVPDACWRDIGINEHALQCHDGSSGCGASAHAGGIGVGTNGGLHWSGLGGTTKYDSLGWSGVETTPNSYETLPSTPSTPSGMVAGEAFVRRLDTSTAISAATGNAYDTDNNPVDFIDYTVIPFTPRNHLTVLKPETGTPATGAKVSVTDGLSATSSATVTGNPPYAQFVVPGVATGTWTVFIDSNSYSAEIDTVNVVANSTTPVPNSVTTPTWPGIAATVLSTNGVVGIISGKVLDATNAPIAGGITVTAGGVNAVTGTSGSYSIRIPTGTYDVIANPSNTNSLYESQTQTPVSVLLGDVTQNINFTLSKGGRINGFITRDGVNPLPGVTVVALDAYGSAHDTEASGNNGTFTLLNLTTGSYTVQPVLDTKELSTPANVTNVTVIAGTTTWSSTFTISGAMGQVQGSVTANSQAIKSGVLVVVSTGAIGVIPPTLSSSTLTSAAFYADSSNETGTYSVDVRGSTTSVYNVNAYYMRVVNNVPVISTATRTSVTVTAGQVTSGINFAW